MEQWQKLDGATGGAAKPQGETQRHGGRVNAERVTEWGTREEWRGNPRMKWGSWQE